MKQNLVVLGLAVLLVAVTLWIRSSRTSPGAEPRARTPEDVPRPLPTLPPPPKESRPEPPPQNPTPGSQREVVGVVLGDEGRAPAEARLWLQSRTAEDRGWEGRLSGDGRFAFRGLPDDEFSLSISAPGYLEQVVRGGVRSHLAPAPPLTYVLSRGWSFTGETRDGAGKPVPGVRITVREGNTDRTTLSDAEGRFKVTGIDPGVRERQTAPGIDELRAKARGFAPLALVDLPPNGHRILILEPAARMKLLLSRAGAPAKPDFSWTAHRKRIVDGELVEPGNVTFLDGPVGLLEDLEPGAWEIKVEAPGHAPAVARVELRPGPAKEIPLNLVPDGLHVPDIAQIPLRDSPEFREQIRAYFAGLNADEKASLKEHVRRSVPDLGKVPEEVRRAVEFILRHD